MINVKGRNAVLATLAILVGVAIGLAWWFISSKDSAPPVSALFKACENTVKTDFDYLLTIHGNKYLSPSDLHHSDEIVTGTYDVQISGEDFHMAFSDGTFSVELMRVDNAVYVKEDDGAWRLDPSQDPSKLDPTNFLTMGGYTSEGVRSDNPLCPEIGAMGPVGSVDEGMASEISPGHFQITGTGVGAPEGPVGQVDENTYITQGHDVTWDYWLNDDGQLLKTRELITLTGHPDAGQVEVTTVISGVGEPNVIKAPI